MIDLNHAIANALLDRLDTELPAGSILEIRTGAAPGADAGAGGTLLCAITLPASPWSAATNSVKTKNGTWQGTGVANGNAGHYRFKNAAGTKLVEGSVTATGGGGDLTLDNISIAIGQTVTVTGFQYSQ